MSNQSLQAWETDTAFLVVTKLPFEDFESAFVLAENYLSSTGGWNPDDEDDPTGPGDPVSGATPDEASDIIRDEQFSSIYSTPVTATITISLEYITKLVGGLSDQDVLDNIEEGLNTFISDQLSPTDIQYDSLVSFDGTPVEGALTTQPIRFDLNAEVEAGGKLTDPKAIVLNYARSTYSLDISWNVTYLYTKENNDLFVLVEKYLADYSALDLSDNRQFFVSMDPVSYEITGGALLTREPIGA